MTRSFELIYIYILCNVNVSKRTFCLDDILFNVPWKYMHSINRPAEVIHLIQVKFSLCGNALSYKLSPLCSM